MRTGFIRKRSILPSNFGQNALIQLVMAIGVGYILIHAVKLIFIILSDDPQSVFLKQIIPNVALQPFDTFLERPWVIFTYFWGHESFWNLVSNMLWLYCFGSVIQTLIGFKEIITLFISSCVAGALVYLGASYFLPGIMPAGFIMSALPGVTAFAAASIILAPRFRFYLGERLAIPLWLVLTIFVLINVLSYLQNTGMVMLLGGSTAMGITYIQLIRFGYHPGMKVYALLDGVQKKFNPDPYKNPHARKRKETLRQLENQKDLLSPEYVDRLLDKINQKGYHSLTQDEKDALMKASEHIS